MHPVKRLLKVINPYHKHCLNKYLTSKSSENGEDEVAKENVVVEHYDQITTIGINRPEKKNCLNTVLVQELADEINKFENDESSVIGILHGIGGNFCSGYDLAEIAQYDGKNEEVLPQYGSLSNRTGLSKKPLIAAINGYALGIGFELALMCDLRVMEESAMVGFANRRLGIPILCGGTVRLPALIGYSRAMDLILTGRIIEAKEALSWGLINRCTCLGAVLGDAITLAKSFCKFPQNTLLADRTSTHFATFSAKQLEEALQFEKDNAFYLLFDEGAKGAKRFISEGVGKHGKFVNLTKINTEFKKLDKDLL